MAFEVSIAGQDRRHAVDIIMREIDECMRELERRDYVGGEHRPKILSEAGMPKKVTSALASLRAVDEEIRKLTQKADKIKHRLDGALPNGAVLDTARNSGETWRRYVIRESSERLQERIEGSAEKRSLKRARLRGLKDRLVVALATDAPIEALVTEFRELA